MPAIYRVGVLLFLSLSLSAQDAYYQHFYGNEADYNPAMVGQRGAMRLGISYRTQWYATDAQQYTTQKVTFEESLPCFFLDYGLFARQDEEGEGKLTTTEFGGRIAAAFPLSKKNADDVLNLRVGFGLAFGQRSVDFSKLTFLDQLDPFFGLVDENGNANPTGFQSPLNGGASPRYSTPSFGVSLKGGLNRSSKRPLTFDVGIAVHNLGLFVNPDSRQSASLLGLDNALGERWVFTALADVVFARDARRRYWSARPSLVIQEQEGLRYAEFGSGLSWNKTVNVGAYYHVSYDNADSANNESWTSLQLEIGDRLGQSDTRLDIAFSYAFQFGFLKNYVRPPLEVTATFSFGKSTTCMLMGYGDEAVMSRRNATSCFNFTTARNRLYDNIWYREQ
ncbi:MAG: PorP/SprF family type IX secretion system membrane protein [Bacteroidota bacterium]